MTGFSPLSFPLLPPNPAHHPAPFGFGCGTEAAWTPAEQSTVEALCTPQTRDEDVDVTRASFWGPSSLTSLPPAAACDPYWTSVHPEYWTKHHVWEWLQFCCDQYKLDANCISFCHFNISGLQLCSMTQEEFIEAAGICGEYLYFILQNIRSQGQCHGASHNWVQPSMGAQ